MGSVMTGRVGSRYGDWRAVRGTIDRMPPSLRLQALAILLEPDPDRKAASARDLRADAAVDSSSVIAEPAGIPGRPTRPVLLPHTALKARPVRTLQGRAALLHAIAHIEL